MTQEELQRLIAEVGEMIGTDYSPVAMDYEPAPWEYEDIARRYLRPTDRVLDIGTGGGERFLGLADAYAIGVGVDHNPAMVRAAQVNLDESTRSRVTFEVMDGRELAFEPESFDVVLTRHNKIWVEQIVDVLRPGGYFISQQIGERSNRLIWDAFGWGVEGDYWRRTAEEEGYGPLPTMEEYAAEFERHGCRVVARGHCEVQAWFRDVEALVLYLKAAPFPEELDPARHLDAFNRYLALAKGPRGYETNESTDLLVIHKGDVTPTRG